MRKATRMLLNILKKSNPNASYVAVKPQYYEKSKANHCHANVMQFLGENEELMIRSGWMVGEYFGDKGTAIIPHYWVYDPVNKNHYDITPLNSNQKFEYVFDIEIFMNIDMERYISVPVPLNLLDNGNLRARVGEDKFIPISAICHKNLYQLVNLNQPN